MEIREIKLMWKPHKFCRICNGKLTEVFSFGKPMPLANDFKGEDEAREGFVPLEVMWCQDCCLAQTSAVVASERLYANYSYVTSTSTTMREHFKALWDAIKSHGNIESVIEIGSNDGSLLMFAKENGAECVGGIDPAENLAHEAHKKGIQTIIGILDKHTAKGVMCIVPKPDVIIARHVFAHIDNWKEAILDLDTLSNVDTQIVIEVPWVVNMLEQVTFDCIYHEHLSYVSVRSIDRLLEGTPFRIQKVMHFEIHGGSLAIFLRRRDNPVATDASVAEFMAMENITRKTWRDFSFEANKRIAKLRNTAFVPSMRGKKVCGFGASAKSTVWISACGFTKKDMAFICDCTPQKQGKLSPGTDIPIVPESELDKANVAVLWAWNFSDEIKKKHQAWIDAGGVFINPHND